LLYLLSLGVLLSLGACAPTVIGKGPDRIPPRLVDDWIAVMSDGAELPLEIWRPADHADAENETPETRAVVIALHGFGDYANAFRRFAPQLAAGGIAVYAYDQRGFGEAPHRGRWAGAEVLADDAVTVAALARADQARRGRPDLPVILMGESMGGAVAMLVAARTQPARPSSHSASLNSASPGIVGPGIDAIVLSAPAVWGRAFMPDYQARSLAVSSRLFPWLTLTPRGLPIRPSDNIPMLIRLSRDALFLRSPRVDMVHGLVDLMDAAQAASPDITVPTLFLYGDKDDLVPRRPTCAAISNLPDRPRRWRVVVYEGGHHMLFRDLRGARVARDIAAWIADPEAVLPSGDERLPGKDLDAFCERKR
jgi:alpha-beta hydrolase superfamily lysophospholipase